MTTTQASINLLTFICADTFNFKLDILENYLPYLIVHLQLNASPHDAAITQYRNLIYCSPKRTKVEIVVLNWAAGTSLGGHTFKPHNGSMYFMQGDKLEKEPCQKNITINSNHKLGVHLRFSAGYKYSAYALSCSESTCTFDTTKVSQLSPGPHCNRSGIQAVVRCLWNAAKNKWVETDSIDDGITSEYERITMNECISYLEREALIALSIGNISEGLVEEHIPSGLSNKMQGQLKPAYWHKPRALESFYLETNDRPKGTMALLDEKQGKMISDSLASLSNILVYMADLTNLPEVFSDCDPHNMKICLNPKELEEDIISHNLSSGKNDSWGTVVELGNAVEREAREKFDEIKSTTKSSRLVVWYRNEGVLRCISDEIPSFTSVDSDPRDITG